MVTGFVNDSVFIAAVLVETLAVLSFVGEVFKRAGRPELELALNAYHGHIGPFASLLPSFGPFPSGIALADCLILAAIWFFLFTIRQANRAMAPQSSPPQGEYTKMSPKLSVSERVVDASLPALLCGLGSVIAGLTLLPLLTPVLGLWLLVLRALGRPSWFEVSRSYFANLIFVAGLSAGLLSFR